MSALVFSLPWKKRLSFFAGTVSRGIRCSYSLIVFVSQVPHLGLFGPFVWLRAVDKLLAATQRID